MAQLKLTKNELRAQQIKLSELTKYLPTLQLKKALLQSVVSETRQEIYALRDSLEIEESAAEEFASLFSINLSCDLERFTKVQNIKKRTENIAGAEVPYFQSCSFEPITYDLFETPVWLEGVIAGVRAVNRIRVQVVIAEEKLGILEHELREVSIRVNLFEKILIPRCEANIRKIKIFLGDQMLAAVSQAKVAKAKILERKLEHEKV